jgi:hypothetical protein
MQGMLAAWNAWKEKFKDNIVDWGDQLKSGGKIVSGSSVSDGPFVEAKEAVGGYVLLSVSSFEEAVAIAKTNPMHDLGVTTEVRTTASSCPHVYRFLSRFATAAV